MHVRTLPLLTVLIALAAGCMAPGRSGIRVTSASELKAKGHPTFGEPIALPGTSILMFPFAVEFSDDGKESWEFFSISGGSLVSGSSVGDYFSADGLRWNNVVFFDSTGAKRILLDEPALITRFHASGEKSPVRGDYLLFGVTTRDTNGDALINGDDAVVLLRTDGRGGNKRPITPADDQLVSIAWFDGWTYLRVRKDSDADHKFTERDRIDAYRVRLDELTAEYKTEIVLDDAIRQVAFDIVLKSARQPKP